MIFTNVEKCVYSKKSLKQRRQPPTPPSSKVEGSSRRKSHLPFKTRFVVSWENNGDGDITMPLSLKTIGSAGYRDQ